MKNIKEYHEKYKYIDIRRLIKYFPGFMCYIIVGPRGDGKSTSTWNYLKSYLAKKKEHRMLFLVRHDFEVDFKKHKIATNLGLTIEKGNMFFRNEYEEYFTKNGQSRKKLISHEWVGEIVSLNGSSTARSGTDYVKFNFDIIFWDEFQDETTKKLPDEFAKLKSIIETTFRTRKDALIFCVSNEVKPENTLSQGLGIDMRKLLPGNVYLDRSQKVCYYRTKTNEELKKLKVESDSYKFGKNSDYNKFAFEGEWKIDDQQNVEPKPADILRPFCNFIYAASAFAMYTHGMHYHISDTLITKGKTYALTQTDATMTGEQYSKPDFMMNIINGGLRAKRLTFSSAVVKEKIAAMMARFK